MQARYRPTGRGQQTTAVKDGDDYILNGTKIFITNAGEADVYVIFAMTDKTKGTHGISAFIVEKGMPGGPCRGSNGAACNRCDAHGKAQCSHTTADRCGNTGLYTGDLFG